VRGPGLHRACRAALRGPPLLRPPDTPCSPRISIEVVLYWPRVTTLPSGRQSHIRKHLQDKQIRHALERLSALMSEGPARSLARLQRQKSMEKVVPLISGLRRAKVRPDEILRIVLGVIAAAEEDKVRELDFPYVQVAKVVRRKKGVSSQLGASDSRGRSLLLFGRLLVRASSHAIQAHLAKVLSRKIRRSGRSPTGRFVGPIGARLPVVPPLSKS